MGQQMVPVAHYFPVMYQLPVKPERRHFPHLIEPTDH
jgi:hypothetical protein